MWTSGVLLLVLPRSQKPPLSLEDLQQLTAVVVRSQSFGLCLANVRHERIHTKRGSCVMMPPQEEDADDLAALEVLDEVRGRHTTRELALALAESILTFPAPAR